MYMRFVASSVTMSERRTGEPVVIICDISVKVLRGNLCRDLERIKVLPQKTIKKVASKHRVFYNMCFWENQNLQGS